MKLFSYSRCFHRLQFIHTLSAILPGAGDHVPLFSDLVPLPLPSLFQVVSPFIYSSPFTSLSFSLEFPCHNLCLYMVYLKRILIIYNFLTVLISNWCSTIFLRVSSAVQGLQTFFQNHIFNSDPSVTRTTI